MELADEETATWNWALKHQFVCSYRWSSEALYHSLKENSKDSFIFNYWDNVMKAIYKLSVIRLVWDKGTLLLEGFSVSLPKLISAYLHLM